MGYLLSSKWSMYEEERGNNKGKKIGRPYFSLYLRTRKKVSLYFGIIFFFFHSFQTRIFNYFIFSYILHDQYYNDLLIQIIEKQKKKNFIFSTEYCTEVRFFRKKGFCFFIAIVSGFSQQPINKYHQEKKMNKKQITRKTKKKGH